MHVMRRLNPLLKYFSVPKYFYRLTTRTLPWCVALSGLCLLLGAYAGLYLSPPDYQQGDAFRILYVHVPCAFLSLFIYTIISLCAFVHLVWKVKIADVVAASSASIGATFTLLALITGAIWGKPMWGTWWVWDARLTSELILFFLYLGYMGLRAAIPDTRRASRLCSILALVGLVDIPVVHYSVIWWNTLHQGPTVSKWAKPAMPWNMLWPLLVMLLGFGLFYLSILFLRSRGELLQREHATRWAHQALEHSKPCNTVNTFGVVIS